MVDCLMQAYSARLVTIPRVVAVVKLVPCLNSSKPSRVLENPLQPSPTIVSLKSTEPHGAHVRLGINFWVTSYYLRIII